jgi:hypothetical protein
MASVVAFAIKRSIATERGPSEREEWSGWVTAEITARSIRAITTRGSAGQPAGTMPDLEIWKPFPLTVQVTPVIAEAHWNGPRPVFDP